MIRNKIILIWGLFHVWVKNHQPIARLISLTAGLSVVITFMPSFMRDVFWKGLLTHKILSGMLLIFSFLAISLVWSAGQQVDTWGFLFINLRGSRPIWLDQVMTGFTQIGSVFGALGVALILFLAGFWILSYELILGSFLLWLVVELMKFLVHRSRPFIRLTQARIVGGQAIGQSFPSGHTSQAFFMATLIVQHFHFSLLVLVLFYTVAMLVGITRMYVGAHYPRDVLAGAILGSAWGLLGMIIEGNFLNDFG